MALEQPNQGKRLDLSKLEAEIYADMEASREDTFLG
jgi:hypothetical protein